MLANAYQCLPIFTKAYKCSPRILFGLCQFIEPNFSSHKKVGAPIIFLHAKTNFQPRPINYWYANSKKV